MGAGAEETPEGDMMADDYKDHVCGECDFARMDQHLPEHLRVCHGGYSGWKRADQVACRIFKPKQIDNWEPAEVMSCSG